MEAALILAALMGLAIVEIILHTPIREPAAPEDDPLPDLDPEELLPPPCGRPVASATLRPPQTPEPRP